MAVNALARIRTGTALATAPSRQRVYRFHHQGKLRASPGGNKLIVDTTARQPQLGRVAQPCLISNLAGRMGDPLTASRSL